MLFDRQITVHSNR